MTFSYLTLHQPKTKFNLKKWLNTLKEFLNQITKNLIKSKYMKQKRNKRNKSKQYWTSKKLFKKYKDENQKYKS